MYRTTSASPGSMAPANRSPTETLCGAKFPARSCACWYAEDRTSPSSTSTMDGGMIWPSVPEAQIVPLAMRGS